MFFIVGLSETTTGVVLYLSPTSFSLFNLSNLMDFHSPSSPILNPTFMSSHTFLSQFSYALKSLSFGVYGSDVILNQSPLMLVLSFLLSICPSIHTIAPLMDCSP